MTENMHKFTRVKKKNQGIGHKKGEKQPKKRFPMKSVILFYLNDADGGARTTKHNQ